LWERGGPGSAPPPPAGAMGFDGRDYVLANYMVLYREYCLSRSREPRDMLFANKKQRAPSTKSKNLS
jgi:hypothetical protein